MKATNFEYRHQTLIHLLIVGIAFLTYLVEPDDIVWALVRGQSHPRLLERLLFAIATLLIGASTALRTWASAYSPPSKSNLPLAGPFDGPYCYLRYPQQLGNLLFSIGLGFLAPVSGFIFLIAAETLVAIRLIRREETIRRAVTTETSRENESDPPALKTRVVAKVQTWKESFQQESGKWGLFLTMIVFTLLLIDRIAEILACVSVVVWTFLNWRSSRPRLSR